MLKHHKLKYLFIISLLILLLGWYLNIISPIFFFIILFLWIGLTVWGSFDVRSNYYAKVLYHAFPQKEQTIALTFDDGPTEYTLQILDLLDKYQAKATFFCIGKQVEKNPEIVRQILKKGHSIGNHSYSHSKYIGFFSTQRMIDEIQNADFALLNNSSCTTKLYRPPFGVTNPHISKASSITDKLIIGWSVRSLDTVIHSENKILRRILSRLKSGDIILLHDTSDKTVRVLEQLLIKLKKMNYQSILIHQLLNLKD